MMYILVERCFSTWIRVLRSFKWLWRFWKI